MVILVVQNILQTSSAAEGSEDGDSSGLDASAQEGGQVVVAEIAHLEKSDVAVLSEVDHLRH